MTRQSGQIIIASYGAEGRLLESSITSLANLSSGSEGEVALAAQEGGWYKVFLLDASTFVPLETASIQNIEPSGNTSSRGQEVFELLRAYAKTNGVLSGNHYRAAVSYQNRNGEIWYFTEDDFICFLYSENDSENLFTPLLCILNTGKTDTKLLFSQTDISSCTSIQANFTVDAAAFSGEEAPILTEYIGTALAGLEDLTFKENCRHSFTRLLTFLDGFLGERSYSIADLGFHSFAPINYSS